MYLKLLELTKTKALMIKINVIISNPNWKRFIKNPNDYIERKTSKIILINKNFSKKKIFCTLLLSGNKQIKDLNKKFRKKNKATDVLSFPFYEKKELNRVIRQQKEIYLGDIIVNLGHVKNKRNFTNFKLEFDKLWVHGFVHLFGHDHKNKKDFLKMNKIEKKYINLINIKKIS